MSEIVLRKEGNISIMSIDRPNALNALNRDIIDDMDDLVEEIKKDTDVRCLVIYSEKNFAAGADIKNMVECDEAEAKDFIFTSTYNKIFDLPFPVIAAIEGYALGGGLELAFTADIRIAGENAKMGFPEVTLGIIPGAGGTIRVPRIIGESKAKELIFTGDIISAKEAEQKGLVNRVVPDDQVYSEAMKLAGKIAMQAPIAVAAAKNTIRSGIEEPDDHKGMAIEEKNWSKMFSTEDQKEGMRAFLEKRKPVYKNR